MDHLLLLLSSQLRLSMSRLRASRDVMSGLILMVLVFTAGSTTANEVVFTHYSEKDGIASNFVNCVWQSPEGYIWLGTDNGLQRFDGNKFVRFLRDRGKETLPSTPVLQILSDKAKHMWLNMGLSVGIFDLVDYSYKQAGISAQVPDAFKYSKRLFCDSRGRVLLLLQGWGVLVYKPGTRMFEPDRQVVNVPAGFEPASITEDTLTGDYYIGGPAGIGICRKGAFYTSAFNPLQLPMLKAFGGIRNIRGIAVMGNAEYFVFQAGLKNAVYRWTIRDGLVKRTLKPGSSGTPGEVTGILDIGGDLWAFGRALFNLRERSWPDFDIFFDDRDPEMGMRFYEIRQVCPDRDGNIWVATDNGLYMATQINNTIRHGRILQFKETEISGAYPLSGQSVLFAARNGDIEILKYDRDFLITPNVELRNRILKARPATGGQGSLTYVYEQPAKGIIWLAWTKGRIMGYDQKTKKVFFLNQNKSPGENIVFIAEFKGLLFFVTESGKLFKRDGNGCSEMADFRTSVHKVMQDSSGNLWIASKREGLLLFDPLTLKTVRRWTENAATGKRITDHHIRDMAQINDTFYAVAGYANLNIINKYTGAVKLLTSYEGLPAQVITALKAEDGIVWMSTTAGICKFVLSTGEFRLYDQRDGLINTANSASLLTTCARLPGANLIFSGAYQFLLFSPSGLKDLKKPKDVTITDIRILNTYIPLDSLLRKGVLEMDYSRSTFTIMFSSLSFAQGNKLTYYYKMEGAEDSWIKAEANYRASFVSLGPGHYVFRVKCVNFEGLWSEQETVLKIYVRPAFYQTWWFILSLIILGIIPVYMIYRSKIRRLLEVQRLREKVARDLHDDMGSTLTSISILSEVASNKLEGNTEMVRSYLSRISHNSQEMMDAMDDIVWTIKPANDSLPRIIARMREYTASVLETKHILYSFDADNLLDKAKLNMEARRNLFLVFKEALNNIAKYADAGFVKIVISVHQDHLHLRIQDDGNGFGAEEEYSGNGIGNMRSRVASIGGTFELSSEKAVGTKILVIVPVTN